MHWWRTLRARVRGLLRRNAVADEIRDEIDFHLAAKAADYESRGLSSAAAAARARVEFGNPLVIRDRGYDIRGGGFMESVWRDLTYGARLLVRDRTFSLVAVLTFALGIGLSAALFSVIDAALLRPLPYPHAERLVRIGLTNSQRPGSRVAPSLDDMSAWTPMTQVFARMGTFKSDSLIVLGDGGGIEPQRIGAARVTHDYLSTLGITPYLGRLVDAGDEQLGRPEVALLGYRYWKTRFSGDPSIVGKAIHFSNGDATIIGVLPDDVSRVQTRLFLALQTTPTARGFRQYSVYARLADGVSLERANRELAAWHAPLNAANPKGPQFTASAISLAEQLAATNRPTIGILAGAVGFVLLIACVNVASLQLARGTVRTAELAVRASMGAGRARLLRQLITESLVLALAAGVVGIAAAWLSLDTLVAYLPVSISSDVTARLNWPVIAAATTLAAVCGLVSGLLPAFRLSRATVQTALSRSGRGTAHTLSKTAGGVLIAVEIAAAVVLTTGGALMVRSFLAASRVPLGFDPDRFVTVEAAPVDQTPQSYARFYTEYLSRIRALPGIAASGGTTNLPLDGSMSFGSVHVDGGPSVGVSHQAVTSGYFEALGIPLVSGRWPTLAEEHDSTWAVLDARAAQALFPAGALGQHLEIGDASRVVIGVAGAVEPIGAMQSFTTPQVYYAYAIPTQTTVNGSRFGEAMTIAVATTHGTEGLTASLRSAATATGIPVIVRGVRTGRDWWSDSIVTPRQRLVMLGLLGALGLVLALIGVFGVTAFAVARRTQEIGVRLAFGASPTQVVRRIMADAAIPMTAGILAGVAGAWFMSRAIAALLFQTDAHDVIALAGAAAALAVCGLAAAWIPARRASALDPLTALRSD